MIELIAIPLAALAWVLASYTQTWNTRDAIYKLIQDQEEVGVRLALFRQYDRVRWQAHFKVELLHGNPLKLYSKDIQKLCFDSAKEA